MTSESATRPWLCSLDPGVLSRSWREWRHQFVATGQRVAVLGDRAHPTDNNNNGRGA